MDDDLRGRGTPLGGFVRIPRRMPKPKNHLAGLAALLRRPAELGGVAGGFESGPEPRDFPWDILLPRVEGEGWSPTPQAERQPTAQETRAQGRDLLRRFPLPGGIYAGAFLDAIARTERNTKGYGEVNPGQAWGRYQMTKDALIDGGMLDPDTMRWTGPLARRLGIESEEDFLASPQAQEKAFQAYLKRTEHYLRNHGALAHLGRTIE